MISLQQKLSVSFLLGALLCAPLLGFSDQTGQADPQIMMLLLDDSSSSYAAKRLGNPQELQHYQKISPEQAKALLEDLKKNQIKPGSDLIKFQSDPENYRNQFFINTNHGNLAVYSNQLKTCAACHLRK